MAELEEEQLKLKLEQYRSSNKPQKSILKPSGNTLAAASSLKKPDCSGSDGSNHALMSFATKFKSTQSDSVQSRANQPVEPSEAALQNHLRIIMQKIMTDVNSLVNTGKIEEVQASVQILPREFD